MTTIYRVSSPEKLHPLDPLNVLRFYPDLTRHHSKKMQDRQDLILYLASIHRAAVKSGRPLGFCQIPLRLMSLRHWVYDYRTVFDYFFEVVQIGYNCGLDNNEISTVIPKKLPDDVIAPIKARKLVYMPPPLPAGGVVSKVFVRQHLKDEILSRLAASGRLDLHAPVVWLLDHPTSEVNFYFVPSGKLQLRDTSVWPISAVETWPSWLREALFGEGIDIESAYTQFLMEHVREAYANNPVHLQLFFPDLLRSLSDKREWRREICVDILGLDYNDDNISIVKKICMSLANGSKISPGILIGHGSYSITRDIIINGVEDVSPMNLIRIGERLSAIAKQYSTARKVVCMSELGINPSRKNQKMVFSSYFEWEREARYKIWEAVGRHGIMVHDGIDGIPTEYLQDIPGLVKSLNIRLTKS
ncbi:hypothetical protein [Acinetobacter sp.]|uniref:hypothetical protein n=1 Tax=Acinetobacter sp. TaxID=472 RepID=UPI00388FFD25